MVAGEGERGIDALAKGRTGLAVGTNGGTKDQDRHHPAIDVRFPIENNLEGAIMPASCAARLWVSS